MDRIRFSLILVSLIIFGCLALSATQPAPTIDQTCTAAGCGFSLQVELVGEMPSDFVLTAAASTGETVSVHCLNGMTLYDVQTMTGKSPTCSQTGVSFLNFAPEQVMITVRWGDLEVSQSFQPAYQVFFPNGPTCEPECRSARVDFDLMKDWKTYSDPVNGFSFKYPANFGIVPGINDTSFYVGEQIFFYISNRDPLDCQGDCSVIETTERVSIAGLDAIRVTGYSGILDDDGLQQYQAYLFPHSNQYYNFTLSALNTQATNNNPGVTSYLKETDIKLFDRMMGTFRFTN
ncbi:MAG: hypothetical protein MUO77_17205 [Anaerolineales bacterium]|nr:hypothetical protein [Anaerolineales bacterium]